MLEDSLRAIRKYYYKSPSWLKKIIGNAYILLPDSIRLGPDYKRFHQLLVESRSWSEQRHKQYQFTELYRTISLAYENVPYYRKRFKEYGVSPKDLTCLEDIQKFPYLTKKDVKNNLEDMCSVKISPKKRLPTTTGGSTAEPMRFYHIKGLTRTKERAFVLEQWSKFGYYPRAKTIQLKGRGIGKPEKKIFWEYEPIQNYLEMDSNYLKEDNIPLYINKIWEFNPEFMIGFPSSIYLLAKYIIEKNLKLPTIKAVFLASENIYPWQVQIFKKAFQCPVSSHYGHSEMVLFGSECPYCKQLHFLPQYGYLEVINEQGQQEVNYGGVGELVGTSFHNDLMPFIRYRTQDYGIIGDKECSCGHNYTMLKSVEGRLQEFILTKEGRLVSICVMGAAHFDVLDNVYETQYYQDTLGELIFKIVPKKGFSEEDRNIIKKVILEKIGSDINVTVECVNSIKKTKVGKHIMIEQCLPLDVLKEKQDLVFKE